jgi:uncharacterized protein with FMN-binding domain
MNAKLKKCGIVILVFVVAIAALYIWMMADQRSKMSQLVFEEIDMSRVNDGTYIGTADIGLVNVEVEVTVKGNKIASIKLLKHENGFGSKAETIIDEMVRSNTYEVDAVSGATGSSQTIKSAVCDALLKGVAAKP